MPFDAALFSFAKLRAEGYYSIMPSSDILQILLSHDQWATQQILETCAKIPSEQFHQRFDMGPGSLHDTIAHIIGAMQTWTQTLAGQRPGTQQRIDEDGKRRTPQELVSVLEIVVKDFKAQANRLPLSETVTRERNGKTFQFTRAAVLAHVATHGMHHRAQCLNMLKQLGVKPLLPSSVSEWTRLAEGH
jgi:uncharacterized damage-inducible protein DinB